MPYKIYNSRNDVETSTAVGQELKCKVMLKLQKSSKHGIEGMRHSKQTQTELKHNEST